MHNLGTLYAYEMRKIWKRKIVWITLGIMLVLSIFMGLSGILSSSYSVDGVTISAYQMMADDRAYAKKLSGRSIDDTLLKEMQEAYRNLKILQTSEKQPNPDTSDSIQNTITVDSGNIENTAPLYSEIYSYAENILGSNHDTVMQTDAAALYVERTANIQNHWDKQQLTSQETSYWKEKETQVQIPPVYEYTKGFQTILSEIFMLNIMVLLLTAICLSNVFSDEHLRKTDQMTLCCSLGRKPLYLAKMLAGSTFSFLSALFLFSASAVTTLLLYGTDGFHAALQLILSDSSWTFSLGEGMLIFLAILLIASLLYGITAMLLSELTRSSVAAMAIMVGPMILTLFLDMPKRFRILSQLYSYLPTQLVTAESLADNRLISLFGTYFTKLQTGPVLYLLLSLILLAIGGRTYRNYQVRG